MTSLLSQIHKGMDVVDSTGDKIGIVDRVKMTDENPDTTAAEQVSADQGSYRNHTIIDDLMESFTTDKVPGEVHDKLLREGFVRVDADGLFAGERYVTPDKIAAVTDDEVKLRGTKNDLFKTH